MVSLTAHSSVAALVELCARYRPDFAVIGDPAHEGALRSGLAAAGLRTQGLAGAAALSTAVTAPGVDTVIAAIVGAAGLVPTVAAARAGHRILLANKEAIVCAGSVLMDAVRASAAQLLPLDSEHAPGMPELLVRVDDAPGAGDWQYGLRELWRVSLSRRAVVVHRPDGTWERSEDDALISPQLPGFEIPVDALFPG